MKINVYKFGGTSVGSVEKIQAIADRILSEPDIKHVVVVSAMGHLRISWLSCVLRFLMSHHLGNTMP